MKNLQHYYLLFLLLFCVTLNAQESENIRLGVKKIVPNNNIESLIANNDYNFIDAFEYELTKLLIEYASANDDYQLNLVEVSQGTKVKDIRDGEKIDALIFTFSETVKRRVEDGIHFSIPYFQNKAIGLIVNDPNIDVKNIGNSFIRIGHVENTTSAIELESIRIKHPNNIELRLYQNHELLMKALRAKDIDAATGDVSRLVYEINEGEFYFGGNLPTRRSKIRDNYCIGITKEREDLKPFFDKFITENEKKISTLENKWLTTALDDAYGAHYNKTENKLKSYIKYLMIGGLSLVTLVGLLFYYLLNRKNKKIRLMEAGNTDAWLGEILSLYDAKGRNNLNADGIAQVGGDFFKTAKTKITYVGSGGFLSDDIHGKLWSEALYGCLSRGVVFERVIDLPKMENNKENQIRFKRTLNFLPFNLERDYISRYIKWLFIEYNDLKNYQNLKMIDSRGAALWGYGIIIMIKDEEEVLIFTTNKKEKSGSTIMSPDLAREISKVILDITEIGNNINSTKLNEMFFSKDIRLGEVKNKIDTAKGDLDDSTLEMITRLSKQIEVEFSEEKSERG